MVKMERDPFNYIEPSPERRWSPFEEDPDKDKEREKKPEKPKKRWFEDDMPDEPEKKPKDKKPETDKTPEAKKAKTKNPEAKTREERRQELPELDSEEFEQLNDEQQKHVVARHIVARRAIELEAEIEELPPGSPEAVELAANLALIDALDEKLADPELEVGEAVEEAYQNIMEELEEIMNPLEESEDDLPEEEDPLEMLLHPKQKAKPKKTAKTSLKKDSHKKTAAAPTSPNPVASSAPSSPNVSTTTPHERASSTPARPPEQLPPLKEEVEASKSVRRKRASNLVVTNALTEMFDRRHTDSSPTHSTHEAAPLPTQQSRPERMVNPIKRSIEEKEQKIRQIATKHVVRAPFEAPTATFETSQSSHYERPSVHVETLAHQGAPRPERSQSLSQETSRNLKQASTSELLEIGSRIRVDGRSLRDLFNSNEIDRKGLSKIVAEALKGGDVKRVFKKVQLGEEAKRGRKFEMRHDDPKNLPIADVKTHDGDQAHTARTSQLLDALHAVQRTTTQSADGAAHVPDKKQLETAVTQQRRAAYAAAVAVATLATGTVLALLFFVL